MDTNGHEFPGKEATDYTDNTDNTDAATLRKIPVRRGSAVHEIRWSEIRSGCQPELGSRGDHYSSHP